MDKIFTDIKHRIIQYIENQSIGKENFYRLTGISSSNFKGKGALSEIGGEKIVKILTIFDEISPDWLLLGKGEMLRQRTDNFVLEPHSKLNSPLEDEIIKIYKSQIEELKKDKEELKKDKALLTSLIETKLGNQEAS